MANGGKLTGSDVRTSDGYGTVAGTATTVFAVRHPDDCLRCLDTSAAVSVACATGAALDTAAAASAVTTSRAARHLADVAGK
jgi:hypothetical protein